MRIGSSAQGAKQWFLSLRRQYKEHPNLSSQDTQCALQRRLLNLFRIRSDAHSAESLAILAAHVLVTHQCTRANYSNRLIIDFEERAFTALFDTIQRIIGPCSALYFSRSYHGRIK